MFSSEIQKGLIVIAFYCILQIIIPLGMNHFMGKEVRLN